MSTLVAVYGDQVELERALEALANAGLSRMAEVIGDGYPASEVDGSVRDQTRGGWRETGGARDEPPGTRVVIPAVAAGGSGAPPASPAVLTPLAAPLGPAAVGVVEKGVGMSGATGELERITGASTEEATYYADVIRGGGSLLVVKGDASQLDRAEVALERHAGQGVVRR